VATTKSKAKSGSKTVSPRVKSPELIRGFPGTDEERAKAIRRLADEHRETLRRLGK
jgi:hypothetical protein